MSQELLLERIKKRLDAMHLSERAAVLKAGLKADAVRTIRRGSAPAAKTLVALSKVLDCSPSYLLEVAGEISDIEEEIYDPSDPGSTVIGYVSVPTLQAYAGMGGGGVDNEDLMGPPELLPEPLIRGDLRGNPLDFVLMEVEGQSMEPTLVSGDRVLVDRRKTNPSQPGVFVIHDGYGFVAKWVHRIAHSDPPALRIVSQNDIVPPYEVTADEARIIGRVVWFARQL